MPELYWNNIEIAGIAGAVPKQIIDNLNYSDFFSRKESQSVVKVTGIAQRRFADGNTCASDLCLAAAEKLITTMEIDRRQIDALIFTCLTPDYRAPATGVILQQRLGLPTSTMAFDLPMGCSGYMYGLSIAFNLCRLPHVGQVLLLNGETKSKTYPKTDKATSLLFGDGGTATLIRKNARENPTSLSLHSDGSRWPAIQMPGGGYRHPTSLSTLKMKTREDGSIRSDEHGAMDGAEVFNFAITDVPHDIKTSIERARTTVALLDFFIFHQPNKFITDHITKKLKIPSDKVIYSMQKFGNTASVSIPLTIVSELNTQLSGTTNKILLSGFGVGLSWGTFVTELADCNVCDLIEI